MVVFCMSMSKSLTALNKAIEIAGGQTALAKSIGVVQQNVWSWVHRFGKAPPERCIAIEKATNGRVTRYDLRRDVFGDPPKKVGA